jgi:hypothetical protein
MAGVAEERGGHCALRRNDYGRHDGPHHCGLRVQYLQQRHLNRGGSRDINRRSYDRCPVLGCTTNVCAKGTTSRCSTARLNGSRCERSADAREKRPLALPHCCPSKSGNAMPQIEAIQERARSIRLLDDIRSSTRHVVARRVPLPESHLAPSVQGRGRPANDR